MARRSPKKEMDPSLQHLPPQNLEAEESVIASVFVDNSTLDDILEVLSPDDFYKPANQKIFETMIELNQRSQPIDLVTLSNRMKDTNRLESIGGYSYLASLDTVPLAVNAKHYATIIREKASLRRLIKASNDIAKRCYESSEDVDDIIDFAENAIFKISEDKTTQSFYTLQSIIDENIDSLQEKQGRGQTVTGVPTGFGRLNTLTSGFQKSDLIILAARPGMGKTAFALNIARNAAVDHKVPTAVFSLEMSKEQLCLRLLCSEARVDSAKLRGGFFSKKEWEKLTDAADVLHHAPIFINDSPDISATEIRAKARRLKMDQGLGLIIIDYLQLMKTRYNLERRDLEIGDISRSLKALAKELQVPVLALSQLNRKLEERSDKRPQLSDLRESGALEQDADVVAFIYRDEVYNKKEDNPNRGTAEIILAKQRNGPTGTVMLTFFPAITRFESLVSDEMAAIMQSKTTPTVGGP